MYTSAKVIQSRKRRRGLIIPKAETRNVCEESLKGKRGRRGKFSASTEIEILR